MNGIIFEKFKDHLFDSHSHIASKEFVDDIQQVVENAKLNGVEYIFDASLDLDYSLASVKTSERFKGIVYSFVGIDPDVFNEQSTIFQGLNIESSWFEKSFSDLRTIISSNSESVVGIGETGMDFYHNKDSASREKINSLQKELFNLHLELARSTNLPLTIHSRYAERECLSMVEKSGTRGIFHSYTGDYATAKSILDAGWGLGVNGIVTFKNASEIKDLYKKLIGKLPNNVTPEYFYSKGIYFESDAPYLSPEGKRGERNEPANVRIVFENFIEVLKS